MLDGLLQKIVFYLNSTKPAHYLVCKERKYLLKDSFVFNNIFLMQLSLQFTLAHMFKTLNTLVLFS